jgi:hypothetical protein
VRPCRASRPVSGGGPSDPLVGGLNLEDTDQGLVVVLTHDDGSRTNLRTVDRQCVGPKGRPGDQPGLFSSVVVLPRAGVDSSD